MPRETVHVLLVEDDEVDAEYIMRSLRESAIANPVTVVNNGVEALEVLMGTGGRERLPRPYIILLDLNMPGMNGLEFLHRIREDEELRRSVIFVITTSNRQEDMDTAYAAHVAGYIIKTNTFGELPALPTLLAQYGKLVEFPELDQ